MPLAWWDKLQESKSMQKDASLISDCTLSAANKKQLDAELTLLRAHGMQISDSMEYTGPADLERHLDYHALGAMIAKPLSDDGDKPDAMAQALRDFHNGKGTPVLVLKHVLTCDKDNLAETEEKAKILLLGLSYMMGMGYHNGKGAVEVLGGAHQVPFRVQSDHYTKTDSQSLHKDWPRVEELSIGALACMDGGKPWITTDFTDKKILGGKYPHVAGVPARFVSMLTEKVAAQDGDIILFRNNELRHARHNHRNPSGKGETRHVQALNAGFKDAQLGEGWEAKVSARIQALRALRSSDDETPGR